MHNFCDSYFHPLPIEPGASLPEKFTFPFYYEPHTLSVQAVSDLQRYLETQTDFIHNFGLNVAMDGLVIGKMFGVMVVENSKGDLGYLAAFSGKLAESNDLKGFVPPVFDTLDAKGFYKIGEAKLNALNSKIDVLENALELKEAKKELLVCKASSQSEIEAFKKMMKAKKNERNQKRGDAKQILKPEVYEALCDTLKSESIGH